jgi:5-formyltetrahydrofolate cyclo-ligase
MGEIYDDEKRLIRRRMQDARRRLSAAEIGLRSTAACRRVLDLPAFDAARHVVVYAAIGNEVDPMLIAETAGAAGKRVYVPVPDRIRFEFVPTTAGAPTLTAAAEHVLFVVPGVAFDEHGGRLGRGDGWYDRALAPHALHPRLGLAYEFQLVPTLPQAPWDIRMHAVVTEERVVGGLAKEKHL